MKLLTLSLLLLTLSCASKNCREIREEQEKQSGVVAPVPAIDKDKDPMKKTAHADRVQVFKPDGSLQCGMGKAISVSEMQKQLGNLTVHKSVNKNDGLMRIQSCGAPTGNSNVYEIDRKDLAQAIMNGFKEWTFE